MFDAVLAAAHELPALTVPDGTEVLVEGDPGEQLLVLVEGSVEVVREGVVVARVDEPGAVFGELAALLGKPITATVKARGQCAFRVSDDPRGFLRSSPDVAVALAEMLARRLDAASQYLVDLRHQYADREDHLGMVDVVLESISHHQGAAFDAGSDREQEAPY